MLFKRTQLGTNGTLRWTGLGCCEGTLLSAALSIVGAGKKTSKSRYAYRVFDRTVVPEIRLFHMMWNRDISETELVVAGDVLDVEAASAEGHLAAVMPRDDSSVR